MGLSAGYDSNGILLALSFHILILLIYNEKNTLKRRIFLGCSILNFIAVFITARVGVLALLLGLLLLAIQKKEKISDKLSPYLKLALPTFLLIVIIFSINPKGPVSSTLDFIFEPFINYAKYNEFRTQSTDALIKDHYKLPHTKRVLFFGNGYDNAHPFYGANTDVGYLQIIFGLGIVGLCILLSTYLFWFILIFKNLKRSVSGLFRDINLFTINYIIIIFVNSFKGPYLLSYSLIFLFSFTFFLSEKFKP
jgi:O-antigen ligase